MRTFLVFATIGTAATLGGCAYGPGGYGSYGGGVSYGTASYDSGYSNYGDPYWGWYGDYYYPGTGYYVYDSYRRPRQWTNAEQNYWMNRQQTYRSRATASGQRVEVNENWRDFKRDRKNQRRRNR